MEYVPRPEYGQVHPRLETLDGGVVASWSSDELVLSSPLDLALDKSAASGRLHLHSGETASFALQHAKQAATPSIKVWGRSEITTLEDTVSAWESWSELHESYVGPWKDLVQHSGRVLQSLSFAPTGAICAGGDHFAARGGGRQPQLGLPLRLGPGRFLHYSSALGGGVPRRSQQVLESCDLVHGRVPRPGRRPPDHVRRRRRKGS